MLLFGGIGNEERRGKMEEGDRKKEEKKRREEKKNQWCRSRLIIHIVNK